jgi:class 3 adenylate cyclase
MIFMNWSPNDLVEQIESLLDGGWDVVGYWCDRPSVDLHGFILTGRNTLARAREALERVHREGGMPAMRYQVSTADKPPSVDDEICRVSRDGFTVVACDFTGMARLAVRLHLNTRADVVREEREKCEEIMAELLLARLRYSSAPTE